MSVRRSTDAGQRSRAPTGAAASAVAQNPIIEHPLTLKVMRLSKPPFQLVSPLLTEADDVAFGTTVRTPQQSLLPTTRYSNVDNLIGISDSLTLPRTLGNLFLGEEFCCIVSVFNHTEGEVTRVTAKIEIDVKDHQNQHFILLDTSSSPIPFAAGASHDWIVRQRTSEAGVHKLRCAVSYIKNGLERRSFYKMFQFRVEDPLKIKHKIAVLPPPASASLSSSPRLLLELQIANVTTTPLFFDHVSFSPASSTTSSLPPSSSSSSSSSSPINSTNAVLPFLTKPNYYIPAGCLHQFIFALNPPTTTTSLLLGSVQLRWRSYLAEPGARSILLSLSGPVQNNFNSSVVIQRVGTEAKYEIEKVEVVTYEIENKSDVDKWVKWEVEEEKGKDVGVVEVGRKKGREKVWANGGKGSWERKVMGVKEGVWRVRGVKVVLEGVDGGEVEKEVILEGFDVLVGSRGEGQKEEESKIENSEEGEKREEKQDQEPEVREETQEIKTQKGEDESQDHNDNSNKEDSKSNSSNNNEGGEEEEVDLEA